MCNTKNPVPRVHRKENGFLEVKQGLDRPLEGARKPKSRQKTKAWLVLYTWLQHTDPALPHYGSGLNLGLCSVSATILSFRESLVPKDGAGAVLLDRSNSLWFGTFWGRFGPRVGSVTSMIGP